MKNGKHWGSNRPAALDTLSGLLITDMNHFSFVKSSFVKENGKIRK